MNNTTLWNISLQQIQIFLRAVSLKNFTQVANELSFTPSMVSKTITAMENELKLQLFVRKPHLLTPTPAGEYLAREWRQLIGSFDSSIVKARALQCGEEQSWVLSFIDSSNAVDQLVSRTIRDYVAQNPGVHVQVEKHDMHRAVELLNVGMLDLAMTSEMEVPYLDEHGLPWEKTCTTDVAAYVPRGNHLFARDSLSFSDLAGESLLALSPVMHPSYHDWITGLCKKYGFLPEIAATFRTVRSLMFNLEHSSHIFIGDSINADWCSEDLKMFPLPEKNFSLICWRRDADPALCRFKDFLKAAYHLP